jgi:hypothetical protein
MLDNAIVFRIRFREIAATLEHDPKKASPGPDRDKSRSSKKIVLNRARAELTSGGG